MIPLVPSIDAIDPEGPDGVLLEQAAIVHLIRLLGNRGQSFDPGRIQISYTGRWRFRLLEPVGSAKPPMMFGSSDGAWWAQAVAELYTAFTDSPIAHRTTFEAVLRMVYPVIRIDRMLECVERGRILIYDESVGVVAHRFLERHGILASAPSIPNLGSLIDEVSAAERELSELEQLLR